MTARVQIAPSVREFFVHGNDSLLEAALRAGLAPSTQTNHVVQLLQEKPLEAD